MIPERSITEIALRTAELSLQSQIAEWKRKMKAAQDLRRYYKTSDFAKKTISVREKDFKKKYWAACGEYQRFKQKVLGEL